MKKIISLFLVLVMILSLTVCFVGCDAGEKGDKGEQGPQGEQGIQGEKGEKGETGEQGQPGKDGVDGEDGHTPEITIGKNGNWYIDGADTGVSATGPKGELGFQGPQGPQGEQGIQGEKGEMGVQGLPGKDGEDGIDGESAYETFKKYYPEYAGTEKEWITDVAMGNICNLFGHKWDEGVVTIEPTKGADGEKIHTCFTCDEHKYEVLPKIEVADAEIYEIDGIKYVNYGSYPQTHVGEADLIIELNKLTTTNYRGYYEYNGNEYAKVTTTPYHYDSYKDNYGNTQFYKYSDGSVIKRYVVEWFIVEPIKWRILTIDDNSKCQLMSDIILDAEVFYSNVYDRLIDGVTVYVNDYIYSDVRTWLNNDFLLSAFDDEKISTLNAIDSNKNISDLVGLLSASDIEFGSLTQHNANRRLKVSDYAIAKGAQFEIGTLFGSWWLRTPFINQYNSKEHNKVVYVCYEGEADMNGHVGNHWCVDDVRCKYGIVPSISIVLD